MAAAGAAAGGTSHPSLAPPPPLALTMGDPAGIGLEIALRAWAARIERGLAPFVMFGDAEALTQRARHLGIDARIKVVADARSAAPIFHEALPVINMALASPANPGLPDARNGPATIASIEAATAAVALGQARALVTNPIAKSVLYEAGFAHPGHTEFLGALAERFEPGRRFAPVMLLASDELKVVPLTIHIALAAVPSAINKPLIFETVHTLWQALRRDFGIAAPRIAIAGLNPHAGESASIGLEERDIIAPAIEALKAEGLTVTGPHPADTLFHASARKTYDAVLAMYHDQALIPIKTLAFDRGVNVTLGLPFVRTSPDHGTAFDIAGQGIANPESLIQALLLAADMASKRALNSTQFKTRRIS